VAAERTHSNTPWLAWVPPSAFPSALERRQSTPWWLALCVAVGVTGLAGTPAEPGVLDASWTAPTANTDGTPLTDLASYRVYFGPSATPCPTGTFVQISSPTARPGPNSTVAVRLTNLTTGVRYNVAVAAVDTSGNQSACSTVASATAQNARICNERNGVFRPNTGAPELPDAVE